jgi:regulator of RNase E activity RraA
MTVFLLMIQSLQGLKMKKNIIDFIKRNRVSTTELADCMGKSGSISDVRAINKGHFRVGSLYWVYASGGTNWDVHKQLEEVKDHDIVFVEALDHLDKAIFGDLVSKYLILYKQAGAIVTNGLLRDAPRLIKENWPIWCTGFNPVGYKNEPVELSETIQKTIEEKRKYYEGAIAVCDDTGVIVIPEKYHTEEFLEKIKFIEEQEDIWFECIDRKKYSTYETVCLKKYLSDENE